MWTTRADGQCDFVNRAWRDYTGLDRNDSLESGWRRVIHPDDLASFEELWSHIRDTGAGGEIDVRLRRFDGQYRWFVFRPSPLPESERGEQRWCWLGLDADEKTTTDGRLRRLFDMMPVQAGFLNTAMVLEFANLKSLRDFNMTFEQLEQWTTSGIIHVDDHENTFRQVSRLLTTGDMMDMELRMLHPDGAYRWTRSRCVPVRDANGNIVRYVSCQIDVDDLKRAQALLAAEVELLEMVARGEVLGRVLDALSHHVEQLCSSSFCCVLLVAPDRTYLRIAAAPNLPAAFQDLFDGKDIDSAYGPCSLAVTEKTPVIVSDLANDSRWRDPAWLPLVKSLGFGSCRAVPILSASGEVSGVVAIHRCGPGIPSLEEQERDVIDRFAKIAGIAIARTEADAALQAREAELRQAYAQLAEGQRLSKTGSFTSDIRQDWHHWSDEFYRIFEIDSEMAPRLEAVRDRIHPEDLPLFDAEIQRGREGRGADFTFRALTPSAGLKHLRGVSRVIEHIEGRPIFMGIVQDVTESRQAEEGLAQARSELAHVARVATLNAMTASIAHEVSQPLSGILTNSNTCVRMLSADPPNLTGAAETVRRTIRDANRASEVIKRLRAMFSTKAQEPEMADLNDVAREVIALSAGEIRRAGVLVQTAFADNLPRVSIDRVQIQQVILNLLLNAADAMAGVEDRPRTLLIRTCRYADGSVQLVVRDSGTGIDADKMERLFDAFYTTKAKGMGVGLSISRSIITRHNGRIWAENNGDQGATFSFCIPGAS